MHIIDMQALRPGCIRLVRRGRALSVMDAFRARGLGRHAWSTYAILRRAGMCPYSAMQYLAVGASLASGADVAEIPPCGNCGQLAIAVAGPRVAS
jgi:hypothetical protein